MTERQHDRAWNAMLMAVLLMALLFAAQGCQSPMEVAYGTRATFNQTITDLTAARQADIITAPEFEADVKLADKLAPALDVLDASAVSGNVNFWVLYQGVRPQLHDLTVRAILTRKTSK